MQGGRNGHICGFDYCAAMGYNEKSRNETRIFMKPIKIIFFDIDGTLIDPATGNISPKTVETLQRLEEKGILRGIVTGRPPASLPDFGALHFDVMATFNGSLCYTDREIIYEKPIEPEEVQQVLQNAAALGRPVSVAVRSRLAANGVEQDLADYYRVAGLQLTKAADFDDALRENVYQIMLSYRPGDEEAILRGTKKLKIALSWERAADVIPISGGKGAAIRQILRHFGLDSSQAMAFGDNHNDMEMLRAVGTGVAMGNATKALKEIADDVCEAVSEDGIYHYCLHHGLI